ncbi:LysR family transcriptional regulator [Paenibacillus sp. FSL K6-1318]|uniref:LysR family transcriptional regulator n=1 Tax=Paenibacillus sp. FSL K6-1318 TaxID=2975291 RepID=UPI0030EF9266
MEIRLIKTFQAIVKYGNFQRAAEALQYSQPTITMQIKKLEEELGMKLFERGKTITLTSAGRLLNERADLLLREYDELNVALTDFMHGDAGIIRIGASEPSASSRLPEILRRFSEQKPKVQVQVRISTTKDLMRMLLDDEIDIALCNEAEPHIQLDFQPLLYEDITLLLPASHPLQHKQEIHLKDLKGETFLLTPGTCSFRIRIEEMISSQIGQLQRSPILVDGITVLKYFVQANMGIALAPVVAVSPPIPGTITRPVRNLMNGPRLGVLTRKNSSTSSKITEELVDEIKRLRTIPDEPVMAQSR